MYSFYDEALLKLGATPEQTTLPRLTLYYNVGVSVEGHKGLFMCNDKEIVVKVGKEKVKIAGENLVIKEISGDSLIVGGKIESIGIDNEKK